MRVNGLETRNLRFVDPLTATGDNDEIVVDFDASPGGGGGGGQQTQEASGDTDFGFLFEPDPFDLGEGIHPLMTTVTLVAIDADGETLGFSEGDIALLLGTGDATFLETSVDGSSWVSLQPLSDIPSQAREIAAEGDSITSSYTAFRYVRVHICIADAFNGTVYAGINDPVASVQLDLSYL